MPEDDPLTATVLMLDRDLARGGPGAIPSPQANFNALSPLPARVLAAGDRAAELGCEPIAGEGRHALVRLARSFETLVGTHSFGGSLQLTYDDPRTDSTLKAVVPALLAIESGLAELDGINPGADGLVEAIAGEIRTVGRVYPYRERTYLAVGELVRRVLAVEARLDGLEVTRKKVKPKS